MAGAPLTGPETDLLPGGIPLGHAEFVKATARLMAAGWLAKDHRGWTITADGLRAVTAFPDTASFTAALNQGTPTADTPTADTPTADAPTADSSVNGSGTDPRAGADA